MEQAVGPKEKLAWDPKVYEQFSAERSQPFYDLLALCSPIESGRAVDLGSGPGGLTVELHRRLRLTQTTGFDNSPAMLENARRLHEPGVNFRQSDIATFGAGDGDDGTCDLVFSNAALQWVEGDHPDVLTQWCKALRPGGQLAVQVPTNADHASHLTAARVALEEPFLSAFEGSPPVDPVLSVRPPAEYAELLYQLGFVEQSVRLQVYGHLLPSTEAVVDWVSGTSLTRFRRRLEPGLYDAFRTRYQQELLRVLGDHRPYFYAFKRILVWGRLPTE